MFLLFVGLPERVYYIKLSGNKQTKSDFILRVLGSEKCGCVDTVDVKKRLQETGLFLDIKVDTLNDTLYVHVKEFWYIWPAPIINYSTDVGITLGIAVTHSNFRGYGERLYAYASFGGYNEWAFGWESPTYRFINRSFNVSTGKSRYTSSIYKAQIHKSWIEGGFSERISQDLRIEQSIGVYFYESEQAITFDEVDRFAMYGFTIKKDTRDWLNYPKKGYAIKGVLEDYFGNFAARRFDVYFEGYKSMGRSTFSKFFGFSKVFGNGPIYILPNLLGTDDALRGKNPGERMLGKERFTFSIEFRHVLFEKFPFFSRFLDGGFGFSTFVDMGTIDRSFSYSLGFGFPIFLSLGGFLPAFVYNQKVGFGLYFGSNTRIR